MNLKVVEQTIEKNKDNLEKEKNTKHPEKKMGRKRDIKSSSSRC